MADRHLWHLDKDEAGLRDRSTSVRLKATTHSGASGRSEGACSHSQERVSARLALCFCRIVLRARCLYVPLHYSVSLYLVPCGLFPSLSPCFLNALCSLGRRVPC